MGSSHYNVLNNDPAHLVVAMIVPCQALGMGWQGEKEQGRDNNSATHDPKTTTNCTVDCCQ
jgi:hypothetical protein